MTDALEQRSHNITHVIAVASGPNRIRCSCHALSNFASLCTSNRSTLYGLDHHVRCYSYWQVDHMDRMGPDLRLRRPVGMAPTDSAPWSSLSLGVERYEWVWIYPCPTTHKPVKWTPNTKRLVQNDPWAPFSLALPGCYGFCDAASRFKVCPQFSCPHAQKDMRPNMRGKNLQSAVPPNS